MYATDRVHKVSFRGVYGSNWEQFALLCGIPSQQTLGSKSESEENWHTETNEVGEHVYGGVGGFA